MSDEALVGIPTAIDLTTGTRHHRDSIDQVPQPFDKSHLSCGECSTPVHAVRSSAQRRGDKLIARAAHFRLTSTLQAPPRPGMCL